MQGLVCYRDTGEKNGARMLCGVRFDAAYASRGEGMLAALSAKCAAKYLQKRRVSYAVFPKDYPYAEVFARCGVLPPPEQPLRMAKAAEILDKLGIDYEMTIISAHREPDVFFEYAKSAESKGFKVIIAGAGMAAHLPGMCAALFPMPVIGIPMSGKNLEGMDALYSIVQMPPGIPVATVAIDGGMNAAILAAKMLAMSDPKLLEKLKAYSAEMKDTVQAKADRLAEVGYEEYLNNK